jgi:hypothetical protein
MENESKDGKSCCDKSKCCGKALAAIALLAIGGVGGYFCGKSCALKQMNAPAVSAPVK